MNFVLTETPRYWWPVTVHVPDNDNPGELVEQTFEVLFEPRDQDAEKAARDHVLGITDPNEQLKADRASLASVIKNWRGVVDADRTELEFSAERLDLALRQPWSRIGLWRAYHESQSGQARLGNSETLPEPGRDPGSAE